MKATGIQCEPADGATLKSMFGNYATPSLSVTTPDGSTRKFSTSEKGSESNGGMHHGYVNLAAPGTATGYVNVSVPAASDAHREKQGHYVNETTVRPMGYVNIGRSGNTEPIDTPYVNVPSGAGAAMRAPLLIPPSAHSSVSANAVPHESVYSGILTKGSETAGGLSRRADIELAESDGGVHL